MRKLAGFINAEEGVPPAVQVQAIALMLERGWGRPKQTIEGSGEDGQIIVQIIQKVREKK